MKWQALVSLLPMISLANAQAVTPSEHYNQLCPNDGQEVEIQPGLFATYHCDQAVLASISANSNPASDPDACVLACEQSTGCVGSMWSARPGSACYLVEHQGEPDLRPKTRVVYMTYRREDDTDIFPDPGDETEIFPEPECDDLLADAQAECDAKLAAFRTPRCPTVHDQTTTRGGKTYQTWCNHDLKRTGTFYKQNALMFNECLDMCSNESQCKGIMWFPQAGAPCKLYPNASGKGEFTTTMVISARKQ